VSTYFWDNVTVLRNVSLIIIYVLSVSSGRPHEIVMIALLLFLTPCLLINIYIQPYFNHMLNKLETGSLIVLICFCVVELIQTAYFRQHMHDYSINSTIPSVILLVALFLLPSILFYFGVLKHLRKEILDISFYKSHRLFKLMSCGVTSIEKYAMGKVVAESVVKHKLMETMKKMQLEIKDTRRKSQ
jgi:hypothetical protein